MGRRKGELTAAAIDRGWPHQVAVPATECRGSLGRFMDAFCLDLSVCERHYSVFHEDNGGSSTASRTRSTPRNFASDSAANASIRKTEAAGPMDAVVHDRSACIDGRTLMAGRLRDQRD
jgi:hypothetical protein